MFLNEVVLREVIFTVPSSNPEYGLSKQVKDSLRLHLDAHLHKSFVSMANLVKRQIKKAHNGNKVLLSFLKRASEIPTAMDNPRINGELFFSFYSLRSPLMRANLQFISGYSIRFFFGIFCLVKPHQLDDVYLNFLLNFKVSFLIGMCSTYQFLHSTEISL